MKKKIPINTKKTLKCCYRTIPINTKKTLKCCYGISSKVSNTEHVFMVDYDNKKLSDVVKHLLYVQKDYNLSDIYIIESTHGYNAICLDLLPLSVIYNIGTNVFSIADRDFFKYGFKRGYYTLRFDRDKNLIKILPYVKNIYLKSLGHKTFIETFFNFKIKNNKNFNNIDSIEIIQYPSYKDGYHMINKKIPSYLEGVEA